ncbi:MAG TPA: acetate/propionate family kinase [Jatrophihabitans sp.]|jgi:acetate kinase|uniref:acetate/propionate family kinase n=1 Tax=Jatrophihabitans sp. TaxID=1932789 RepID=UPI002F081A8C
MSALIVNAGSSSLKLRLLGEDEAVLASVDLPALPGASGQLRDTLAGWPAPDWVAHRVVHGGRLFRGPVAIDDQVLEQMRSLIDLAPLHQPKSLSAIAAVRAELPETPAYACFDTAFHASIPAKAATYAIPQRWRVDHGIRRYGFHGLSHGYCVERAGQLVDRPVDQLRIVSCHIGAGASITAVLGGRSVDTSMGFTPLEGVVMATRSGSVDPGLLLWLAEHEGLAPHAIAEALENESGLLALAGTADLREVESRRAAGEERATAAFEVYVHRLVTTIGAMTAAAGGLDVLVFTGGVGQNSTSVRAEVSNRLGHLGVAVDPERDCAGGASDDSDRDIGVGAVRVLVIEAREDLQMVREVSALRAAERLR